MSPAHRRDLARQAKKEEGCSQRQACRFFEINRSTFRYEAKFPSSYRFAVEQAIVRLSHEYPEWGADKIGRLVRNENHRVSNDRVRQVRRQEGLLVPPPKKKQRRLGQSTGRHPQKASYPGHVWTWDFIHDWTLKGGSCRILSVVDEYTRQAHCLHVARHIGSKTVQALMEKMIDKYGAPDFIRSDNGPEFIGRSLGEWLKEQGIKTLYIDPGSPWQNGYVESFHDKFRRECLGREIFYTLTECRVVVNDWKRKYNQVRPHRSLGMQTPVEFAKNHSNRAKILPALRPTASTPEESCTTAPA